VLATTLALAALLAWPVAQAAALSKADYDAGKARLSTEYKADKKTCSALAGNAKDICVEEAKGHEKVGRAELEYGRTATQRDYTRWLEAKAESTYNVSRERCDDLSGNPKDVCVTEAKAVKTKAMSAAKLEKVVATAGQDATDARLKADYKVAVEKCDVLAGDAKTSCIATAKAKYGQS
jgi:hypothetical protein